jgi:hypothetical protein
MNSSTHLPFSDCWVCSRRGCRQSVESQLGPITFTICETCNAQHAEPMGLILMWLFKNGGPDRCAEVGESLVSYLGQKYVGWDRIRAFYEEGEDDIAAVLEDELARNGRSKQH